MIPRNVSSYCRLGFDRLEAAEYYPPWSAFQRFQDCPPMYLIGLKENDAGKCGLLLDQSRRNILQPHLILVAQHVLCGECSIEAVPEKGHDVRFPLLMDQHVKLHPTRVELSINPSLSGVTHNVAFHVCPLLMVSLQIRKLGRKSIDACCDKV